MKIKFTQEFVSAQLGNIWLGRVIAVDKETAEKFMRAGYAEELKEEVENGDSDTNGSEEPPTNRPKRRGRAPK